MNETENLTIRPFLLMEGGPLFNIQKRLGVIKKDVPFTKRRALVAALLTWFPLLILSAIQGRAFGNVPVPFIRDLSAYTRFLLAIPLLLLAENILGPRIAGAAEHFVTSGVVIEKDYQRFDGLVERGLRARDSILAEIIIAVLAYSIAIFAFTQTAVHVTTWYSTHTDNGLSLTWAGWWLLGFCTPLFQFLMLRWLWRLFLWFQFLARVRRLDLQLFPPHPDQAAGLGFVGEAQRFFGILLFAFSVGSAGVMANNILYDKIPLKHFAPAIAAYVVIALLIVVGPLILFTGTLLRTKRVGLHQYGTLATTYTGQFHKKWIQHKNPDDEPLLGTGDIQSLADLGNSYEFVEKMKPLPVDPRTLIHLVITSLLPMAPLLLTVMPLKDVMKLLLKFVM
ncbi:hypothetical protein [Alloacidobacterium sp.]|uniref:hypothetical protein n=1 Tax=Alloacidobacterium sp. TaxID=2951999 RepID=UPI002D56422D|nr:hypothetical protein [Alloacidobacterium sp.]HYK36940.1 hypothetical protein [Alloacidobacterium sp.]